MNLCLVESRDTYTFNSKNIRKKPEIHSRYVHLLFSTSPGHYAEISKSRMAISTKRKYGWR
jgi:hypothetical protein